MALTRNSPIKSDPPAMTKPSSSSPPPPALSLDDDNVTSDKLSSSPSLKRRKIVDDNLEQKKIPAADTNKSQNKNSVAPAAAATSLTTHAAAAAASANMETIDVANILGLKPGDRIEVKWNINDEEEDDPPPPPPAVETGKKLGLPKTEGEEDEGRGGDVEPLPLKSTDAAETDNTKNAQDTTNSNSSSPAPPGMISVWWKATVQKASGEYHILDDNDESAGSPLKAAVQPLPPPPPTTASSSSTDKNQTYNCPKCPKQNMSKQGLYTHYGMVHGGKISRDYPNLLSQQQQQQQHYSNNKTAEPLPTVRIPIYEIVYDPLPSLGFPDYSNEEVAFISNVTLLNLSSEEMMNFRREGEVASPLVESGVVGVGKEGNVSMKDVDGGGGGLTGIFGNEAAAAASKPTATTTTSSATSTTNTSTNPNEIYKEFRSEDDIRTYMNELMQKSMMSTGMNARMATLPRSQQNVIAGRINKALEGLLGKMMEEMGRMEGGSRVVTADVVRRCMEQMRPV